MTAHFVLSFPCQPGLRCLARQVAYQRSSALTDMDTTQLALLLVSLVLILVLARWWYVTYTTQRAEKRRGEAVIRKQELDNAQAAIDEHNRRIAQIIATTERINSQQAKLIQDLTDQINRLLSQIGTLTSEAIRHVATEKTSQETNKRLEDELTESRH